MTQAALRSTHGDLRTSGPGVFLAAWLLLGALLLAWALGVATAKAERTLYSDQTTHVMIASSMWVDGDLEYTLEDLRRFREDYPKENGPRGLYLKHVSSGALYFAKPYLYGAVAAPFYGLFGTDGFIVLNVLCLIVIGAVTALAVSTALGRNWGLFASMAFVLPSAFLPWVFVPHPDLFIAALLALGGYLLLGDQRSRAWQVLGAVILGAALHEKIPFVFVLPFLLAAVPATGWLWRGALGVVVVLSWLLFSSPNIAIDGSLLSYQGLRLYVSGNPYPLEAGWIPPAKGYTGHVFDPVAVVLAILGNLGLIWEKFLDFLVGRQTGIIPYFAAAFALLVIRPFFGLGRSLLLLAGLFSYLVVQWLVFPTNGYGGSGSYGSRYLMQALPLIPLAYLGTRRSFRISPGIGVEESIKGVLVVAAVFALAIQYRVFVQGSELVMRHHEAGLTPPLNAFRIERWLLPTTFSGASSRYVDDGNDGRVRMFRLDETGHGSWLRWAERPNESTFVLYKHDLSASLPAVQVISPVDTQARIEIDGTLIWSGMLFGGQPRRVEVDASASFRTAFDLFLGREIGISILKLNVDRFDRYGDGTVRRPLLRFDTDPVPFEGIDERLGAKELVARGAELRRGWSHLEPWGVWSDGIHAEVSLRVGEGGGRFGVELATHAYVPPGQGTLEVDFLCTGSAAKRVVYRPEQFETVRLTCEKRPQDEYVVVDISVLDPTSPLEQGRGPDPRRLGIGLHAFKMVRLD